MGGAKAVANPHKGDLDDLSDLDGHAEVQGKVRSDVQVESQMDIHVDAEMDDNVDAHVDTLFDNLAQTLIGQEKDEAEDMVTFTLK